ncbi:Rieske 2Fe-2S domain-containing protein [Microbispora sp. NEAU-D428]|uniref:Rieske 2Fe-2S domain-containing protein n=1 Tax=Microbispora sitophila TaxID=2771537 RepID=UPI00186840B1|nr:Rieske 2Fe-2S domain-containing protein [Microbispora sitophila]MBE3007678.1 Rieske 2Fe-2S domain-containing protein [Microbispora sitophila]
MAQRTLDRLLDAIEGDDRLDRASHRLEQGLAFAENLLGITRGRTRGLLHGVWLGHPLHPVFTDLPIGSWTTALVLDLTGQKRAARAAVGVGLAGALAAAVTGLHDWQHTHDNARRVGMVHGTLNTLALVLYGWSWVQRGRGHHLRGRLAALLGYPVIMTSGFLGGTLVYRHRIGVDQTGRQLDPRHFTPVLAERDLTDNRPHRARAGDVDVVLVRADGRIHALENACPHLRGPLSEGWLRDGALTCPWHGSRFELSSGESLNGPASAPAPCFQTRVRDGWIEVRRAPAAATAPPGSALIHQQEVQP